MQKINKTVFTKPEEVMQNIRRVSRHLKKKVLLEGGDPTVEVLHPIDTLDASKFFVDADGEHWRMYDWIEGSKTYKDVVGADLGSIGMRLDAINDAVCKGTHVEVTKDEASRYIIHTYLLISDIISLCDPGELAGK